MYFFPFEPRDVLENYLSDKTRQFIEQEIRKIFKQDYSQSKTDPVANEAIYWVNAVYNAVEIASVPERFKEVLQQPNGIHTLDYVLSCFYGYLEENKRQQLIDYFYPILQRYKIRIGAENLLAISRDCEVPEGKLDLSERAEDVERNYQQDLVNRQGASEVHAFLEEHLDHPFMLPIKALVSQADGYDFSSFAVSMLENLYDRCGQTDHVRIDNQKWYLEKVPEGIRLIFKATLFPEGNKPLADHSLVYLLSKEEDEFYGKLEQFTLTPHTDKTRRICVAGALFSDHLFPLEHPDNLFMDNLEDRLVLDDYFKQFFFASPQGQVGVVQEFEGEAETETSLYAVAILAVLQGFQKNKAYPDLEIKPSKDWLRELLKYREGVHFLDYVLGEFYKHAFQAPEEQQSKKMMNALAHHFLPMMLERKIVYPGFQYVEYLPSVKHELIKKFTTTFENLSQKYSDPAQREELQTSVQGAYENDQNRGITGAVELLSSPPDESLVFFLRALLSQHNTYGLLNSLTTVMHAFLDQQGLIACSDFQIGVSNISAGYRVSILNECKQLNQCDGVFIKEGKRKEFPLFTTSLTFTLTWDRAEERANIKFEGWGYTPHGNSKEEPIFPILERHQCFGETSKKERTLSGSSVSIPKKPEAYRLYFQRFLFTANPEAISHQWSDYFQHYLHVSLAVRPVFLEVIERSNLSSEEKGTIFEKIFKHQVVLFIRENDMRFDHLQTFCDTLTSRLRIRFYRQFKAYLDANQGSGHRAEEWFKGLEAKRPNGDSLIELKKDFEFLETLKKLGQGESIAEDAISKQSPIVSFHEGERFHLSGNARSWLFDEMGNFRKPPEGRKLTHCVLPVCLDIPYDPNLDLDTYLGDVFEVILWPDMPSFAMQRLGQQVFGEDLFPRASVGCLYYQGRQIPFEARKHVSGQLISDSLKDQPGDLARINSTSFTRNFLLTLFLLVSDVHGRNILLKPLEDGTFDAEIFDARAFLEQKDIKKPELVNLLLLLDLMQKPEALDPEVINDFLHRDFPKVLDGWLIACQFENERLFNLFEDVARFYVPNKDRNIQPGQSPLDPLVESSRNSSLLAIPVGGFVEDLFFRAERLQEELQEWTNESPLEILRHVLPLLYKFYKPCFKKESVSMRLEHLLGLMKKGLKPETYSSTSISLPPANRVTVGRRFSSLWWQETDVDLEMKHGLYPTQLPRDFIQTISEGTDDFFCPSSARGHLKELIAFVEQEDHPKLRSILGELLRDQPDTKNFKKLSPERKWLCLQRLYKHLDELGESLTWAQQRAILDVLLETPFSTLSLRRYAGVITDKDINCLNGNIYYLRTLKLDGTPLTAKALQYLAERSDLPLEHLSLRDMKNLRTSLRNVPRKLHLPNLKTLDLRNSSISSLSFDAPGLEHLYLEANFNLVKTNALFEFFKNRAQEKCVIHLNGDSQFVRKVFDQTYRFSVIEFDITGPTLQSKTLYWMAQVNQLGDFVHRVSWLSGLEELMLPGSISVKVCEKLFRVIQPFAVNLKRVVINAGSCGNSIVAALLHYFPDISQISLRRYEQTPIPSAWEEVEPLAAVSKGKKLFCASEETLFIIGQNGERTDLRDSQGLRIKKQEDERRLPQHHSVYLVGELDLNRVMAVVQNGQNGEQVDELYVWDMGSGAKIKQTVLPHRINYLIAIFGHQFLTLHVRGNIGTRLWKIQTDGSIKRRFFQPVSELNSAYVNYPYAYYWTYSGLFRVDLRTQESRSVYKTPANGKICSVVAFDQYVYVQTSYGTLQFDAVSLDQLNKLEGIDLSYKAVVFLSPLETRLLRLKSQSVKDRNITERYFNANFPEDISHTESTIFYPNQKRGVHYEEEQTPFLISKQSERVFFIGERGRLISLSDPMPPISLDDLRSDLRVVAVTENYIAIRIEKQRTREILDLLGFHSDQIKAFPNYLFFKKDQIQCLFGISSPGLFNPPWDPSGGLLSAPLGFQDTRLGNVEEGDEFEAILKVEKIDGVNHVYFPEVKVRESAYCVLNELLQRLRLKGETRIHLEDVDFSSASAFYVPTYLKFKFHSRIRIYLSEHAVESIFPHYYGYSFHFMTPSSYQWQTTWRENQFLCFLALLEVPTDRKEKFYERIVSMLSKVDALPEKQKYYYLNYLSLLHPDVPLLTSLIHLYKKVQSPKELTLKEAQSVVDQYRGMKKQVDSLWPDLWKKIVEKGVRLSDEGDDASARVLFEGVLLSRSVNGLFFTDNKCDLLTNDDWMRVYDAFKEIPDFDIDGFFNRRVRLVIEPLHNLTDEVLAWVQRFFERHPKKDLFKSILLLHGKIESDSEEELTQAVQLIFEESEDQFLLSEFCFEPCFQDQTMNRKQTIFACAYLKLLLKKENELTIDEDIFKRIFPSLFAHDLLRTLADLTELILDSLGQIDSVASTLDADIGSVGSFDSDKAVVDRRFVSEKQISVSRFFSQQDVNGQRRIKAFSVPCVSDLAWLSFSYHLIAQEINSGSALSVFTRLLGELPGQKFIEGLYSMDIQLRKTPAHSRFYEHISSPQIAEEFLRYLRKNPSKWDLETYVSLGAVLMRSSNDQLKEYGRQILDDLLELELEENSLNCYYKGWASYLLENYNEAKEFFDNAERQQSDDSLLSDWQERNIDTWRSTCTREAQNRSRRSRRF